MWRDHTFSQRNKATKRVEGKQSGGRQYKGEGVKKPLPLVLCSNY